MARVFAWAFPLAVLLPVTALAQQPGEPANQRITPQAPFSQHQQRGLYTTRNDAPAPAAAKPALPWLRQNAAPPSPPSRQQQNVPSSYKPSLPPGGAIPFGRSSAAQAVPNHGLPMTSAVPVDAIDGIEVSEPAAPMAPVPGANPAEEDPTDPTALTAPLFSATLDTKTPRIIELRVLNKVTAQAETVTLAPGAVTEFGKLEIEAVQCYQSTPASRPDAVALLAIREHVPERKEPRPLFYGWMYASSPSLTALEHPVYDVTMVACDMTTKAEAKEAAKAADKKE